MADHREHPSDRTDETGLLPTLPAADYLDEDVWVEERERIWFRQWVLVGREHDLPSPGDRLIVDVAGESIMVVRRPDGGLVAFYNLCRHRGSQLVDPVAECGAWGPPSKPMIRCPYHAWTYDLDGRLVNAPFLEPERTPGVALYPVGVEAWGGFVFVHLTPAEAQPLAVQLGPVVDRVRRYPLAGLRRGAILRYEVAANWKVVAENYNECYHCGPVHPELCELVPAFRRGGVDLEWPDGIPHRDGAWTFTLSGTSNRAPFPGLDAAEQVRHKGELVYPNLLLSLSAEHVAAFRLRPLGPGVTIVDCELLFHPDAVADPDFDPSDAVELWDLVNRQDWAVCAGVQRGMASRAWSGGWFAPAEDDTAEITAWYRRAMGRP